MKAGVVNDEIDVGLPFFWWVMAAAAAGAPPKGRERSQTTSIDSWTTKQLSISGMKLAEWRQFSLWNQLIDETKECRQWS